MAAYLSNKELREEIIRCKEKDELTRVAIDMFYLMVGKFTWNFRYKYPEDRKDCEAEAIIDLYLYWRGYDPAKSQNAFAYYTQIIKNGFAKGWRRLYDKYPSGAKRISVDLIHSL